METRRVAGVNSDILSESACHELAVVARRYAAARLGRRLNLVRDGVGRLVCPAPEGNQGLFGRETFLRAIDTRGGRLDRYYMYVCSSGAVC